MSFPTQVAGGATGGSSSTPTRTSNQKRAAILANGRTVVAWNYITSTAQFVWSDDGYTWTAFSGSDIAGFETGSIAAYVDSTGSQWIVATWKQTGTGGGRLADDVYCMVGQVVGNTLTWGNSVSISNANATASLNHPDVAAGAVGTGGMAWVVCGVNNSTPVNYAYYARLTISSTGVAAMANAIGTGPDGLTDTSGSDYWGLLGGSYGINLNTYPSIVVDSASSPTRLHVAWSAGTTGSGKGIRYRTASLSSGVGTWATEVEVDTGYYITTDSRWIVVRWDGTRAVVGAFVSTGSGQEYLRVYETTNFTAFTTRALYNSVPDAESFYGGGVGIDSATGDIYVIGCAGGSPAHVNYVKWTRATTTLGAVTHSDSHLGTASTTYAHVWYHAGAIRWVYGFGNQNPYGVKYDLLSVVTTNGPVSDLDNLNSWTVGGGSGPGLSNKLDESSPDDADYVSSPAALVATQYEEFQLGPMTPNSTGATFSVRLRSRGPSNVNATIGLYSGSTLIDSQTISPLPTSFTTYSITIDATDAAKIADWNNLRSRITYWI